MSSIPDRYMYLGFGIVLVVASRLIARGLAHITDLNTITDPTFGQDPPAPSPQDSLASHTLLTLASSPNADISRSAVLLLLDRLTSSHSESQSLVDDLFSPDPSARRGANLVDALYQHPEYHHSVGTSPARQWQGLLSLPHGDDNAAARTVRAVYWHCRVSERKGDVRPMFSLQSLSVQLASNFHEVSPRWSGLVICEDIQEKQTFAWIEAVLALGAVDDLDDGTMKDFIRALALLDACGRLEGKWRPHEAYDHVWRTREEDLPPPKRDLAAGPADEVGETGENLVSDIDGDSNNLPIARLVRLRRARFTEESSRHADARRRRREAMVLHEGEGSLQNDDIIQRRYDGMTEL